MMKIASCVLFFLCSCRAGEVGVRWAPGHIIAEYKEHGLQSSEESIKTTQSEETLKKEIQIMPSTFTR